MNNNTYNTKISNIEKNIANAIEEMADFGYYPEVSIISGGLLMLPTIPRGQRPHALKNLEDYIKSSIKEEEIKEDLLLSLEKIYNILKIKML